VFRIPLPLGGDALRAVNVYALVGGASGVDLVDGGEALAEARDQLRAGLQKIGAGLGDVRNIFVTHYHRDHYTLAAELRRTEGSSVRLGEAERANLQAIRDVIAGTREHSLVRDLRRAGASELLARLGPLVPTAVRQDWEDPDQWIEDGADLFTGSRTLRAIHTPGHTRGHLVFRDAESQVLFAGDHVLPHITPSVGFEPAGNRMALRDYLESLRLLLELPDARLFPAHGPVGDCTHRRVHELLGHHEERLAAMHAAVVRGASTSYEVARDTTWTRRRHHFDELDEMSQYLACTEAGAHLELMVARGQLARDAADDGADIYTAA
jgi:glyoxylase-like metal-dependent hydrolase (beta-lactamase superfamily II)